MDFRDAKALISAASENDVNSLRAVIERVSDADVRDEVGDTALMHAHSGHRVRINRSGADVNASNHEAAMALILSAAACENEVVRELLHVGADVHAATELGETAIVRAAATGGTETISTLLDAGANINDLTRRGITPLIAAISNWRMDAVRVLLEKGADPNLATADGVTPLISWEIPRLCRGGSRSLTYPAVRAPAIRCH